MRARLPLIEKNYGPDHPKVAIRLNNLARLFQDTHRLTEAAPMAQRAASILRASLGEDHPNTKIAVMNYAIIRRELDSRSAP